MNGFKPYVSIVNYKILMEGEDAIKIVLSSNDKKLFKEIRDDEKPDSFGKYYRAYNLGRTECAQEMNIDEATAIYEFQEAINEFNNIVDYVEYKNDVNKFLLKKASNFIADNITNFLL